MNKLTRNAARCLKCNDIIESKYRHDFVWCSCESIFVDGGLDYARYGGVGMSDSFESLHEWSE